MLKLRWEFYCCSYPYIGYAPFIATFCFAYFSIGHGKKTVKDYSAQNAHNTLAG